ncbi:protein rtoA-like [Argopecten irradians]|uniref:protein rtoA-like n=1 Tax=Argopecten irradians TaxID=31199 RepID=UPI00371D0ED0
MKDDKGDGDVSKTNHQGDVSSSVDETNISVNTDSQKTKNDGQSEMKGDKGDGVVSNTNHQGDGSSSVDATNIFVNTDRQRIGKSNTMEETGVNSTSILPAGETKNDDDQNEMCDDKGDGGSQSMDQINEIDDDSTITSKITEKQIEGENRMPKKPDPPLNSSALETLNGKLSATIS